MNKLSALFGVLQAGSEVVDKARFKSGQLTVNNIVILISAIIALINTFGQNISLTPDQIIGIASGLMAIYGVFNNLGVAMTSTHASISPIENVKILLKPKQLPNVSSDLAQEIEQDRQK